MSMIIDGEMLDGKIASPMYRSHIKLARKILCEHTEDKVRDGCNQIFKFISDWFGKSDYSNLKGLADVDTPNFYTVPRIPGKSRTCADMVMLLIVGVKYDPLCQLAKKESLLVMVSEILLYYSEAGKDSEVDRAVIWLLYLIEIKEQLPNEISMEEQLMLMEKLPKFEVRLLCLQNWLKLMERKSKDKGEYFDSQSLIFKRTQMKVFLNEMFPSVFQSISQDTFNDFWKRQKVCKLKDGRR